MQILMSNANGDWNDDSEIWNCLLDPNAVPVAGDDVVINNSVSFTADIAQVNNITILDGGTLIQKHKPTDHYWYMVIVAGVLTHDQNTSLHLYEIDFSMENLDLQLGGFIDVSGKGYEEEMVIATQMKIIKMKWAISWFVQ